MHKSQGQTLERVRVDLRNTFEKGQGNYYDFIILASAGLKPAQSGRHKRCQAIAEEVALSSLWFRLQYNTPFRSEQMK